jgi:hypothetical protein
MIDRKEWPKTISAGDKPFSLGVFRNSSIPWVNSSDATPDGEILAMRSFIAATAASAWPLLCG